MRQGVYGRHTAAAVEAIRLAHSLEGEPSVFTDAVAQVVAAKLDGTYVPEPPLVPEPEVEAPQPSAEASQPSAHVPEHPRWQAELGQLALMGFSDAAVLVPLLEKHQGSIIFVMTELLGR
jgi:hypothetical protein